MLLIHTSGFFVVRRAAVDFNSLRPHGFKILLEIVIRPDLQITEIPFQFGYRQSGDSKRTSGDDWLIPPALPSTVGDKSWPCPVFGCRCIWPGGQ